MEELWSDLKELMDARTQALAGAREIHTFDRDAADTKERVQVRCPVMRGASPYTATSRADGSLPTHYTHSFLF